MKTCEAPLSGGWHLLTSCYTHQTCNVCFQPQWSTTTWSNEIECHKCSSSRRSWPPMLRHPWWKPLWSIESPHEISCGIFGRPCISRITQQHLQDHLFELYTYKLFIELLQLQRCMNRLLIQINIYSCNQEAPWSSAAHTKCRAKGANARQVKEVHLIRQETKYT